MKEEEEEGDESKREHVWINWKNNKPSPLIQRVVDKMNGVQSVFYEEGRSL